MKQMYGNKTTRHPPQTTPLGAFGASIPRLRRLGSAPQILAQMTPLVKLKFHDIFSSLDTIHECCRGTNIGGRLISRFAWHRAVKSCKTLLLIILLENGSGQNLALQ